MKNKIVLITGGNAGIGKATATGLAKMGATVIIACRNKEKGLQAVEEIKKDSGNSSVELLVMDLASQKSVRNAAEEFKKRFNRLDVLINNAGVFLPKRELTEDGIEKTFATNYLGHFLLTNLLLDTLKASAPSRIINVASKTGNAKMNFDDLLLEKKFSVMAAVPPTKLGLIMFAGELARRLEGTGVTVNSLHPGLVKTTLLKDMSGFMKFFFALMPQASPEKGAQTSIYLASSPEVEKVSGRFFADKKEAKISPEADNVEKQKKLYDVSLKLTKIQ